MRWLAAVLIGLGIGLVAALFVPAPPPANVGGAGSTALTVVERLADGTEVVLRGPGAKPLTGSSVGAGAVLAAPLMPSWMCLPFAALLGAIALMPFVSAKWWHAHYPEVALSLGGLVVGYYFAQFGAYGRGVILHTGAEYLSFFALVGGLYVVSGGILVDVRVRATPVSNAALLGIGAVLANIVGTTGASMLLIRPFMRMNSAEHGGRGLHPLHIVFFIFIVSNCGGCLTPIGDPPLYLGYLKGVPFSWTLTHMGPMWLLVNGVLLGLFVVVDVWLGQRGAAAVTFAADVAPPDAAKTGVQIRGISGFICLALIVAGVFIDPLLKTYAGIEHVPVGAVFQLVVAAIAYFTAPGHVHQANHFNFEPVKEVGLLFLGIFATMAPALAFLDQNATSMGLETPTQFYLATGGLSAALDNAPTYLSFLQIAFSTLGLPLTPEEIARFIDGSFTVTDLSTPGAGVTFHFSGQTMLEAISQGAVFFGAMTYIGNGPNFMVKAIAEARGVKMPSFFGYMLLAGLFLLPVLVLNWLVFIR